MSTNRQGMALTANWSKARAVMDNITFFADDVNDIVREEAERLADIVRENIPYDRATPNAELTVKRKGFNAPLMETGGLEAEIEVNEYMDAGAHPTTSNKRYYVISGSDAEVVTDDERSHEITYKDLLEILEKGTDHAGVNGTVSIPERPILEIVWDMEKQHSESFIVAKATKDFKRRMEGMG